MKNQFEPPAGGSSSLEKEQINDLISFCEYHNFSSDELFTAYRIAIGTFPEDEKKGAQIWHTRKEVFLLAKKMLDYMEKGLAVNKITVLITTQKNLESAPDLYYKMVDAMQVTDKEKKVLRSIVERKRSGTLTVLDFKTKDELSKLEVNITPDIENYDNLPNHLAIKLLEHLSEFKDKKIEIIFSS